MKFLFNKDTMVKTISIAQEVVSTRSTSSVLSNILIALEGEKAFIRATDTKINYEAQISVQIFERGSVTIYCDKFMGILNSLPFGEIEFFEECIESDSSANIIIRPVEKKIRFQMKTISYKKFPEFYFSKDIPYFEISSKSFKEMIEQTSFAVSMEETRYFLNGVFFEKNGDDLNLVATDGRRLSFISKPILKEVKDFSPAIVHPKILNIILKHAPDEGSILVAIVEKKIFFKFANYEFSATLLDGQFPNYNRVIPKNQTFSFCIKKTELDSALNKHISLMLDRKISRIYFNILENCLKITSLQADIGSVDEEIACKLSGEPCTIAFNFNYIEEPLRVIKSEMVVFEFTGEMKAVTMRPEPGQNYFHIIMPMQKE